MADRGRWLLIDRGTSPPGLAALLDDARRLVIEARDEGYEPAGLLIDAETHRLLVETKARETARGRPLLVLGFAVAPIGG